MVEVTSMSESKQTPDECKYSQSVGMPEYRCVVRCQYDLYGQTVGPNEQALRDAVEPFLDWLEMREAGAQIKEVRDGLIGVEDVLLDSLVVLGAHLRSDKDQGVLTMGHFRRLQAAYDGVLTLPTPTREEGGRDDV